MANEMIIFFDGDCNFCNRSVLFILDNEETHNSNFCSLQSAYAKQFFKSHQYEPKHDSIVVFDGSFHERAEAAYIIAQTMKPKWKKFSKLYNILPKFLSNFIYSLIAFFRKAIVIRTCRVMDTQTQTRFIA